MVHSPTNKGPQPDHPVRALSYATFASTSVVNVARCSRLCRAQVVCSRFAALSISKDLEGDLLPLVQGIQAGALDSTDMDEYVLAAVIGLDKAEALLIVEPLHCSVAHGCSFANSIKPLRVTRSRHAF